MLSAWDIIVAPEMHAVFGIDLDELPEGKSWHWVGARALYLASDGNTRTGKVVAG